MRIRMRVHVTRCSVVAAMMMAMTCCVKGQTNPTPHGADSAVCTQVSDYPGSVLPDLPESFSMRVEANILYKLKTTTLHEYYNYDANLAAVKQVEDGAEEYFFYMYDSNQFLTVSPDKQGGYFCFKQDLSKNENREMFGLQKNGTGQDRVYSVMGALHFGNGIHEEYQGTETIRGIPCNKWLSCQYWDVMDATANVYWYFSDEKQWQSISGYSAPVRCHVVGVRWINATYSYPFEHIYEFYDFQADVDRESKYFEVPRNTYCFSENNEKLLPTMPQAYSFNAEVLDVNAKTIGFLKEEYDNKTKIMRYEYRDPPKANSPFGTNLVSQIHDYNTGVAYVIDVLRANCTVQMIGEHAFDNINVDATHVRLRNPNEFLDLNHNYVYQGVRNIRGVDCFSWAAERFDYPDPTTNNPATTWTWYFASEDFLQSMGFRDNPVLPIMLEVFSDNQDNPIHRQMSFYEYNAEEPNILTYDLSSCYGPTQSKNFAFLVPGRFRDVVAGDVKVFKYFVLLSLEAALSVSPLRISKLDAQEAGENVLVTFDLLDKAPLPGDVANAPDEPTLAEAYQVLSDSVSKGELSILVSSPGFTNLNKLTVKPAGPEYSIQSSSRQRRSAAPNPDSSSSGYTGGAMGGMAVGMLIMGALVGFGIMYVVYRMKGGSFGGGISMQRFDNDKDEVASPSGNDA
ncbi:hypothetical protein V1264_005495 [Littorina saxatilis]|uniref:Uncharacterized protein n=2 Tax=Littorina saxatilis TaxID=31220 RepID=A0AAN9AZX0_9CAEN